MVVTETLVVAYLTRRALKWYRGDGARDDRGAPIEDLRELDDDHLGDTEGVS